MRIAFPALCLPGLLAIRMQKNKGGSCLPCFSSADCYFDTLRFILNLSLHHIHMRSSYSQTEAINHNAGQCIGSGSYAAVIQRGFTLIELIMVMVIVGILAVVVAPRFMGTSVLQSRGFADQVQATLRFAQKEAIAQHRNVCVTTNAGAITLIIADASGATNNCNANLVSPAGQQSDCASLTYRICTPDAAITLGPAVTFSFDALGRPWDVLGTTPSIPSNAQRTFVISGATNNILVEAQTGYVHSP